MSRPVRWSRATALLAANELRQTLGRGENLLVTMIIPPAVLAFFATTGMVPGVAGRPVDFLVPGTISLAIIAAGLVNLGIATAYDRRYGVLKRLGGAPIGRSAIVAAKLLAVLAIEVVQVVVILAVATLALGWRGPATASPALAVLGIVLGTAAFAGLGLLLAGTLRAEATLALANGLFLAALMLGGIVLPVDHLATPLAAVATLLPAAALSDVLRVALGEGGDATRGLVVLGAWGAGAAIAAARTFRWE
jgi:ABC-2 type transport system permease protein